MRVFITGASGFIGSVVVQDLLAAGHQVIAIARSDASEKALQSMGVEVLRGSIEDLDVLRRGAGASDGVIHCAFIHDFSDFANSCKKDFAAIETMGAALEGTNKPFVVASGAGDLANLGRPATEKDERQMNSPFSQRVPSEVLTLSLASKGVRSSVIRLAPSVHDKGDKAFIPMLIGIARQKGVAAYVGEGVNRWSAVHRVDAARLFRLALEKGTAGSTYHGIGDVGVPFKQIAEVIGKKLNLPVISKSPEEAMGYFGWMGGLAGADAPASSDITQQKLDWHPAQIGLIADMEENYF